MKEKQARPNCPQGPDIKMEIVDNAEDPKTMAAEQCFRIVQVVPVAPLFVLRPTALVKTEDQTQALPETVRPIRLQGPGDTVDAKTVNGTQNSADAGVDKRVDGTQKITDAGVDKTDNGTQQLSDNGVDKTDNRTQELTDTEVTKTDNKTQNSTETSIKSERSATSCRGVDVSQHPSCTRKKKKKHSRGSVPSSCGGCGNLSQYPVLQDWLPPGYDYHVVAFEERSTEMDHSAFCTTLRLPLKTKEQAVKWGLEAKDTSARITWRISCERPATGKRNLYRKDYVCQHYNNHKSSTGKTKNTHCPAKLSVIIKADPRRERKVSRAKVDLHLPRHPTVVILQNIHNHNVHSADALKHRDVGREATEKLIGLIEEGHTGASALRVFRKDLQAKLGDDYVHASADRALNPDLYYCQNLYKIYGKRGSTHQRRPASSLPKSQKEEEQTDNLMQGQSSQQNPSQGELTTNQEECEAASADDVLSLSSQSDYEEDTEDLVESMIRDISSLRKDPIYSQAIAAMAKQFHLIKSDPSRLLSLFGNGQTSSRRTATRRPDALSPCRPTVTPRPVAKVSSKRSLPPGPQQTHSSPIKRSRMMDYHI